MNNGFTNVFVDKYNAIAGAIVAALTAVFGIYWYVFAAFFLFNVIDWLTGWYKSRKKKEESSKVGAIGAMKKVGYWAIVLVAFVIGDVFVKLGHDIFGLELTFLHMIGWFTLAMLMINEARSILENLVQLGYKVPQFLIKGLAVTEELINAEIKIPHLNDENNTDDEDNTDDAEKE